MKRLFFILAVLFSLSTKSQTFWTETFGFGCNQGQSAIGFNSGNGAWAVTNTGVNNSSANAWFVSAEEQGVGVGVCGAGCGGTNNRTLHIGATGLFLDMGASYNETSIANATDKRAESPTINCTGKTTITLAFNYITYGEANMDFATLWYFNGTVWAQISYPAQTFCCGPATCTGFLQGLWTAYSIALPVSANNNAAVKIGFRWVNDGNGVGTDPSVAVDDITLSTPVVLPIELSDFSAEKAGKNIQLKWSTATELNFNEFIIERSEDGIGYYKTGTVKGHGNSNSVKHYTFTDDNVKDVLYYYRLKLIDNDGSYNYSPIRAINFADDNSANSAFFDPNTSEIIIPGSLLKTEQVFNTELISTNGVTVNNGTFHLVELQNNKLHIPTGNITDGLYILRLSDNSGTQSFKVIVAR